MLPRSSTIARPRSRTRSPAAAPGEREHGQREHHVGGHRHAEPARGVGAGGDGEVDERGDEHPAHGRRDRKDRRPPLAELPGQQLALDL
jgi:hypothetical protein